ncbi:MAG: DNA recombination protein RmuC [Bacteroidales bacterium]
MTEFLLVVIAGLLLVLIYLVVKRGRIKPEHIESAISTAWRESGLDEQLGAFMAYAQDVRQDYKSLEQMLRVPYERGALGEIALEGILSDQLPPDMFGVRKRVLGKIPDAHIKSTAGAICIDSKFPLDNYAEMLTAEEDGEKERFKKNFLRDVRGHFAKIAEDYVRPEDGSAEFAFAFIPSESVYYFLVNEAYDTLREYTTRGVQVVSPLTLSHKIELIKAGVHAKKLSEQAERVRNDIARLARHFDEIDEEWRILYNTHLANASKKAEELDAVYRNLRSEFNAVSDLSSEQDTEVISRSQQVPSE